MTTNHSPTPPENVRAVLADGSEVPLEVVYVGWRNDAHQWDAVLQLGQVPTRLLVGVLPAKTAVGVQYKRP